MDGRRQTRSDPIVAMRGIALSGALLALLRPVSAASDCPDIASDRVAAAMRDADRFETTHSVEDLETSVDEIDRAITMNRDLLRDIVARQSLVRAYAHVFALIDAAIDPTYDFAKHPVYSCLTPPAEGDRQLPSCADPKAIKNPKLRATYEAELRANDAAIVRNNLQVGLRLLEADETSKLTAALARYRQLGTPDDDAALRCIVRESGVSERRRVALDAIIAPGRMNR